MMRKMLLKIPQDRHPEFTSGRFCELCGQIDGQTIFKQNQTEDTIKPKGPKGKPKGPPR